MDNYGGNRPLWNRVAAATIHWIRGLKPFQFQQFSAGEATPTVTIEYFRFLFLFVNWYDTSSSISQLKG